MKRYGICLLLFVVIAAACLVVGYRCNNTQVRKESAISNTVYETEAVTEDQMVLNQHQVEPVMETVTERYYLVSETGFLLVFAQDQSTICLYTHIPITEFPEREQEKLRQGIWFSSMMEVFQYLESYTS
jgi:hypothetical protein